MGGLPDRSVASSWGVAPAAPLDEALPGEPPCGEGERPPSDLPLSAAMGDAAGSSIRSMSAALTRSMRNLRPSVAATNPETKLRRESQGAHLTAFSLTAWMARLR